MVAVGRLDETIAAITNINLELNSMFREWSATLNLYNAASIEPRLRSQIVNP